MLIYQKNLLQKSAIFHQIKLPFDVEAAEKFLKAIYHSSSAWAIWSKLHFCNSFWDCALIDQSFFSHTCWGVNFKVSHLAIFPFWLLEIGCLRILDRIFKGSFKIQQDFWGGPGISWGSQIQWFIYYILYFVSRLSIEEQSDVIMEEYHTGWAARAAQELDEQILSSGIEPVRLKWGNAVVMGRMYWGNTLVLGRMYCYNINPFL